MQYLMLIYESPDARADATPDEQREMMADYFRFNDLAKEGGHFIAGDALEPVSTATTVRVREGKVMHTDGPFAETKEHLGGYYLIEAPDLDRALELAAHIPATRTGCVEVRPLMTLPTREEVLG